MQGTIQFSLGILAEAGLSYVGLGAQPPVPSWGRMLAESQTLISIAPHIAIFPGAMHVRCERIVEVLCIRFTAGKHERARGEIDLVVAHNHEHLEPRLAVS